MVKFSTTLAERRAELGHSQVEAAAQLRVSKQAYINWEVGRTLPKARNYKLLQRYMDITLEELVESLIHADQAKSGTLISKNTVTAEEIA